MNTVVEAKPSCCCPKCGHCSGVVNQPVILPSPFTPPVQQPSWPLYPPVWYSDTSHNPFYEQQTSVADHMPRTEITCGC